MVDISYSPATRMTLCELWQLDLQTGTEVALTSHGDINLEPRYSPDDRQIAFVSTADSGHFNLYVGRDRWRSLERVETFAA